MNVADGAIRELMEKFCYWDDMLSADRDADAVVEARMQQGWIKLWQCVPLLINKEVYIV